MKPKLSSWATWTTIWRKRNAEYDPNVDDFNTLRGKVIVPARLWLQAIRTVLKCDVIRLHATDWLVSGVARWVMRVFCSQNSKPPFFETQQQGKRPEQTKPKSKTPKQTNKNNSMIPLTLIKSHRPSGRYMVGLTSTFVIAFVSHTNYITGRSDVLLYQWPHTLGDTWLWWKNQSI